MDARELSTYLVVSTGVSKHGNSVIRIMLPNRSVVEVATNAIGMAKLAAAGCAVDNDYRVNTGKV